MQKMLNQFFLMNINDFSPDDFSASPLSRHQHDNVVYLYLFYTKNSEMSCWIDVTRWGWASFSSELFPLFQDEKRAFSHPLFQLQIIAKFFNFLCPLIAFLYDFVSSIVSPQDSILILWYIFSHRWLFSITGKSEINNTNGCSRLERLFVDNVHISYVVKSIVSHQTTIDDARGRKGKHLIIRLSNVMQISNP